MGYRLCIGLLVILISACGSERSPELGGWGIVSETQLAQITAVVATITPQPTSSPTATASATVRIIPTFTQTPEAMFELCTPLPLHPLDVISEIVGDPYDPPPPGKEERHHGVDLAYYHWQDRDTMEGEPVQSVLAGVVVARMEDRMPYGNMVIIETPQAELPAELIAKLEVPAGESLYLLYAHLREPPLVNLGDVVKACQSLGEVGMTGWTEIPHLHFETRTGPAGTVFDSILYYDTKATQEEMDNYVLWRTSGVFQHFDPMRLLLAYVE